MVTVRKGWALLIFFKYERSFFIMVRIRTIPKAVAEIKAQDPGSYINERLLRRWVKDGTIKPVKGSYTYTLINLDELERLLAYGNG